MFQGLRKFCFCCKDEWWKTVIVGLSPFLMVKRCLVPFWLNENTVKHITCLLSFTFVYEEGGCCLRKLSSQWIVVNFILCIYLSWCYI